jgi:hypothetical protein
MTVATKTKTADTALTAAWEAHQDRERQAFEESFKAEAAAREEAQKQEAAAAAEHDKLEAAREAADKRLTEVLRAAEVELQVLVGVVQAALIAADNHYNTGVALGFGGRMDATRTTITDRISHVLNLAGLKDMDLSMSPSGRNPLGQPAEPWKSNMAESTPLREQWNIHKPFDVSDPGYPGQLLDNRPIVQRFLKDDQGEWVEVPVTAWRLPEDPAF